MALFRRKKPQNPQSSVLYSAQRSTDSLMFGHDQPAMALYRQLRYAVPIIDAALSKIVRLCGGYTVTAEDAAFQELLDSFVQQVPCGAVGQSLQSFTDCYLDSLLTYGNAFGEILVDQKTGSIAGLYCANPDGIAVRDGKKPGQRQFFLSADTTETPLSIPHPERLFYTALHPPAGACHGVSVLQGLPSICQILLRIYTCIGQNYDRIGNVRYAVMYHPSTDPAERAYTAERAERIAREWSEGMRAGVHGEVRDFVCAGDVEIKVIGAENPLLDTEIPVRQLLEQIVSKLSIPPFLLGLNWSSTERMSSQQADILTSELEYYRRLLQPVIQQICTAFLRTVGSAGGVSVTWESINLQDATELAKARLQTAQAMEIEQRLKTAASC